ncbi:MAG TPA: ABC transporter permease [Pseudonocardiaceae bacterium]|nr:ABC transporter permease [Pseudonocardiaceae bacterium]
MTTMEINRARRPATLPADMKVTQTRVIRSEWVKFWSLDSTRIAIAVAFIGMVGIGILYTALTASHWQNVPPGQRALIDPTSASLAGYTIAQLIVGVLGVLVVTGEYGTGMVRASLSAVPKRLPVVWAKMVVFAGITFVVTTVASLLAFFIGQAILNSQGIGTTIGAPGVLRAVIGMGLYLTGVGLLGVGLGWIIRNTAGAVSTVLGLLLVLPGIVEALPASWGEHIAPYLPSVAGHEIALVHPGMLGPWAGFGVLIGYVAVAAGIGAYLLERRDA